MVKIWNGWLTRFRRRHHQDAFLDTLSEVKLFKKLIESKSCITCNQQTLQLRRFERNPKGWEASVSCKNCNTAGLVNSDGFSFDHLHSQGKARDKK